MALTIGYGTGQTAEGGYYALPQLSKKLRYEAQRICKFRQFTQLEPGFGKNKGDVLHIPKIGKPRKRTAPLSEFAPIPVTEIKRGDTSLTVQEYGDSVQYTGKLKSLAEFDPANAYHKQMIAASAESLDAICATNGVYKTDVYFDRNAGVIKTTGTPTIYDGYTATAAMTSAMLRTIKSWLKGTVNNAKEPTPPEDGTNYVVIGSTEFMEALFGDSTIGGIVDVAKYAQPKELYAGEIGLWHGYRFIEENNFLVNNATYGQAAILGADAVAELVAEKEQFRYQTKDYGRANGLAWYFLGGYNIIWKYSDAVFKQPRVMMIP